MKKKVVGYAAYHSVAMHVFVNGFVGLLSFIWFSAWLS
jgi:hypothetical protein